MSKIETHIPLETDTLQSQADKEPVRQHASLNEWAHALVQDTVHAGIPLRQEIAILKLGGQILGHIAAEPSATQKDAGALRDRLAQFTQRFITREETRIATSQATRTTETSTTSPRDTLAEQTKYDQLSDFDKLWVAETHNRLTLAFETIRAYHQTLCERDADNQIVGIQKRTASQSGRLFGSGLQKLNQQIGIVTDMTQRYLGTMTLYAWLENKEHARDIHRTYKMLLAIYAEIWSLAAVMTELHTRAQRAHNTHAAETILPRKDWEALNQQIDIVHLHQLLHAVWLQNLPPNMPLVHDAVGEWSHIRSQEIMKEATQVRQLIHRHLTYERVQDPSLLELQATENKLHKLAILHDKTVTPLEPAEMQAYTDLRRWYHVEYRPQKGKQLIAA